MFSKERIFDASSRSIGTRLRSDPRDLRRKRSKFRSPVALSLFLLLISGIYVVQTTLAANISINTGGPVEFGQGMAQTTACSGATNLNVIPYSSFTNDTGSSGAFYFSSITVSNIPSSCNDKDFTIRAYGDGGINPLALFNTSTTSAVVINDGGTFKLGVGSSGMTITQSTGTFTAFFTTPVALSSTVFKITVESGDQAESYSVGSVGPGGGVIFYVAPSPFTCGPTMNLTCSYLEAAPTTGTNAWVDANYLWSGNTNTSIGASAGGSAIGTGYRNTLAIVAQAGGGDTAGRAATVARAYRGPNNLSDWFVPSLNELTQLYQRQTLTGISTSFDDFWSSTESDAGNALIAWFQGDGGIYGNDKNSLNALRPIRAF
jgi:hypothetical protein